LVTNARCSFCPYEQCTTVSTIQKILGGKWKIIILWYIANSEVIRFGELSRLLGDITQSTLTKQLRELEADGFIFRHVYQEVPPKVEYSLTDLGKSFVPILEHMRIWGDQNLKSNRQLN
jgi:DNA-binding HxlR family transcriptional regulator